MYNFKNILVPVDFSNESHLALHAAIKMAGIHSKIFLLNTLNYVYDPDDPATFGPHFDEDIRMDHKRRLEAWRKEIPSSIRSSSLIKEGKLKQEISLVCQEKTIDLVIMTTKGRQGVNRLLHPNMSEEVERDVPCPVMVLHRNKKTIKMAHS